ncbi:MAG TPA: potassium channel family protein [Phycisphaerae bacterium]|nr:potassium channel family protein [Phycisphaerae bacterium]
MSRNLFARVASGRFFWLLVTMVLAIVLAAACPPGGPFEKWVRSVSVIGILLACTYAARGGAIRLLVSLLLNGFLVVVVTFWIINKSPLTEYLLFGTLLACLLFALITTLTFVLSGGNIGHDHIYGAICAYVLIAMCFATIYTIQILASHGAFNGVNTLDPADRPWEDMFYFSFTTLSTVGYGDITPVGHSARAVCIVEMLTGTFYVAILIARLAGLYPPPVTDDQSHPPGKKPGE